MQVTLVYEADESPLGDRQEAAVYGSLAEALFQAAWDEMTAVNRWPQRIIRGAHHGSDGWQPKHMRRGGRARHMAEARPAADADAKVLADFDAADLLEQACAIVRKHWVVHPEDVANADMRPYGSLQGEITERDEQGRPFAWRVTGDASACLDELGALK